MNLEEFKKAFGDIFEKAFNSDQSAGSEIQKGEGAEVEEKKEEKKEETPEKKEEKEEVMEKSIGEELIKGFTDKIGSFQTDILKSISDAVAPFEKANKDLSEKVEELQKAVVRMANSQPDGLKSVKDLSFFEKSIPEEVKDLPKGTVVLNQNTNEHRLVINSLLSKAMDDPDISKSIDSNDAMSFGIDRTYNLSDSSKQAIENKFKVKIL